VEVVTDGIVSNKKIQKVTERGAVEILVLYKQNLGVECHANQALYSLLILVV
jgi:hypothetical protein